MERFIGIRHRVKKTTAGQARPTQIFILGGGKKGQDLVLDLPDEQSELDFAHGVLVAAMRDVKMGEDVSIFPPHQLGWRKVKDDEDVSALPKGFFKKEGKDRYVLGKVPAAFEGLREGDVVGMILGGSGDRLAAALSRSGENVGASVYRVPSFVFKNWRGQDEDKDKDAELLAQKVRNERGSFYKVESRDRAFIRVSEALSFRQEALAARIACEQRLHASFIGSIFLSERGLYPEGMIEKEYQRRSANDMVLQNLEEELKRRESELKKAVEATALWDRVFAPISGVGPRLAAAFIASIVDIRRFETDAKLKAYCGAHVLPDGRFPRRRGGEVANWSPDLRQALYLLGDQFNRRPDSVWGQKLISYKAKFRDRHAKEIGTNGKSRYSDGHIHRMATWRTLTKFVEWLWKEWWKLEKDRQREERQAA
ncbi:MAG: hypothetical protein UT86_C0002G0066 [Candidatus Magasanikbacteria bacterium GW2011_GWC2_40_17]|uniref:Transposase IS116/IS110/IS902 C-terminal domain-containing protein n=1 Tax=Candidatus Magasanikbacteria bacterium GW2011_GWA2_42_32 TaxID=1619039 RepID=A0A0G1A848_9BACT|nr:MAG: hypothetical protein UT86_C0002G0066 [Candidatus Magasanikbacteria bacterium GW2011_GWC2_40_17]KKS57227.1 MAG: hypothetical protein UV20_C0002G0016 [Candidatus Magasanikbacteria bacterium GW2011_GWA2_42_32]